MNRISIKLNCLELCKKNPGSIIFAEGEDERVLAASKELLESGSFKQVTLIGDANKIHSLLNAQLKTFLNSKLFVQEQTDLNLKRRTEESIVKYLTSKGRVVDHGSLAGLISNPLYQAGALLAEGQSDCVLAGAVATTANVIRAALSTVGLANQIKTVSGSFLLERPQLDKHEVLCFADSGVVVDPTIEQLVDIAFSSAETWKNVVGSEPIVGFLSFSTKGSAVSPQSEKTKAAFELFQSRYPHIQSEGELQFDAAFVESVAKRKAPNSKVAGKINTFIFPDLNSGNIAYKIAERLAGFSAYGPILQGLRMPYSDLSRGATASDIATSALINRLRAL